MGFGWNTWCTGEKLPNEAMVIEAVKVSDNNHIVLCFLEGEYAVWNADEYGNTSQGLRFAMLIDALEAYTRRLNRIARSPHSLFEGVVVNGKEEYNGKEC